MSRTPPEISQQLLATLSTTVPGLSCEIGTPERKIIDCVAEAISEAYIDQYLVGSLLDIDTKSGIELEQYCLIPGTSVTTPTGVRAIESLVSGDEVIAHTGKVSEILATSSRMVDEEVVTIRTAVGVEYTMTKNHPVWVTKRSSMTMLASQVGNWRRDGSKGAEYALRLRGLGNKTVWDSRDLDRDFIPAEQIKPGDIVWGPDPGPAGRENALSVGLKRLLGYYLSEGHIHHRERSSEIGFSFHRNEIEYQNEVEQLLRAEWGITHVRQQHPGANSTQLICYDTKLAYWLESFAGKGAAGKHIPFGIDNEDWTPLVATYWRGDGTAAKNQSLRAKTVSPTLAHQLYVYMVQQGFSPRLVMTPGESTKIMGRDCANRDTWQVSVDGESARLLSEAIDYPLRHHNGKNYAPVSTRLGGFVGSPVVKVTESTYQGSVHNVEVAGDNSYELLGSFGVHNCGIFGFGRLNGKAAIGVVRTTANIPSTADQTFPLGTQFYTTPGLAGATQQLYFGSTQAVVLVAGNLSCDIPVQCTTVGSQGNVAPDSVTYYGALIGGSTVTNLTAMTGGVDIETDQELRQRFKDTLLRNSAGQSDFYEAICQQNNKVSRVVVFGPTTLYSTQVATPSGTLVLTVNQDVKYAWPQMESVFNNLGQENEVFFSGVYDYTYVGGTSPTLTRNSSGAMVVGDVVDLEFQYVTRSSRNDPINSITNKVDVFVDGVDPFSVTEKTVVSSAVLTATTSDMLYTGNFRRVGSPGSPTAANRFMRLGSVPFVTFPPTITVGAVTYTQGTHYFLLQGNTLVKGSQQEVSGIEWTSSGPANGTELTLTYVYNRVPELLNAIVANAKQICTDVMIHQADFAYLQPNLTVEYSRNYSVAVVNSSIISALQGYLATLPFGFQVKLSTLCMVVQQVFGVVDCKITTSTDNPTNYGVQIFANSTDTTPALVETTDFKLQDNQLALYLGVNITRTATP